MSNINKALKQKNILGRDIQNKWTKIASQNSHREDIEPIYDVKSIFKSILEDVNNLVAVKTAIACSNVPVYEKIFRMAELKGLVQHLKTVNANEGLHEVTNWRKPENSKEVKIIAEIRQVELDEYIAKFEKEIEVLQDELDKFNFTTEI